MIDVELSIVIPCLNEKFTIARCIERAFQLLHDHQIDGEVVVVDNGSTDGSPAIIQSYDVTLITEHKRGYGNALMTGIRNANGKYVIMGDGDDTYDFLEAYSILLLLRKGYQLVMGNRFQGRICKKAMPITHRYIGNPILSWLGKRLFHIEVGDFHCGLRGFHKQDILALDLQAAGMEFASELVIKAALHDYALTEVPVNLYASDKKRRSKLRTVRDGFRHMQYMINAKKCHGRG